MVIEIGQNLKEVIISIVFAIGFITFVYVGSKCL